MNFFKLWPCTFCVTSAPISSRMVSILSWLMSVLMYLIKSSSWSAYAGLTLIHHEDCVGLYGVDTIDGPSLVSRHSSHSCFSVLSCSSMLSIASPLTVHLVGHSARMPTLCTVLSSSVTFSTLIRSKAAFRFGEYLINLLISKAESIASWQSFDCFMQSLTARLRACP